MSHIKTPEIYRELSIRVKFVKWPGAVEYVCRIKEAAEVIDHCSLLYVKPLNWRNVINLKCKEHKIESVIFKRQAGIVCARMWPVWKLKEHFLTSPSWCSSSQTCGLLASVSVEREHTRISHNIKTANRSSELEPQCNFLVGKLGSWPLCGCSLTHKTPPNIVSWWYPWPVTFCGCIRFGCRDLLCK